MIDNKLFFLFLKSRNNFDTSLKQCKHKNGGKNRYTLIEQSPTLMKQSHTLIGVIYSNRSVLYFNRTILCFNRKATYFENSQPKVYISKIGFTCINLLLLQYIVMCKLIKGRKKKEIPESIIGRFWSIIDLSLNTCIITLL